VKEHTASDPSAGAGTSVGWYKTKAATGIQKKDGDRK
jgi:hypothetical protein